MECLPQEIILDILSRLPVTSLLQLKFVCKAWHSLVQDPLLVFMHFSRTAELDPCLVLHSDCPLQNHLYSLELSALSQDNQRVNKIRVPVLPEFNVVGSCKGLLCLLDSSTRNILYVYNPFSRDYIELPKSTELPYQSIVCGFGFNRKTNEYKVIKVVYWMAPRQGPRHHPNYRLYTFQVDVQILTVGNTAWRKLGKLSANHLNQTTSQVLISGRIHWGTWPQGCKTGPSIISFDLEDEQFQVVPKPDCGGLNSPSFDLVDLGGCLSAVVCDIYGQFEIWIMKEYNVKESWIKEYNIGIYLARSLEDADWNSFQPFKDSKWYGKRLFVRVLGLLRTGEVLMEYKCRALFTYDNKDGTFKDLTLPGLPDWFEAIVLEGNLNGIDTLANVNNSIN